jgi:PKD repeat protein
LFSFFGDKEPKSSLTFDAADTFDQDGDELIYRWRFGDGVEVEDIVSPTHSYLEAGEYRVTLFVSDGRETAELNKDIVIGEQNSDSEDEAEKEEERSDPREEPGPLEPGVVINEVFPAPAKDKEAWVELLNTGKEEMNIVDWRLKNKNSSYRFSENSEEVSLDPQQIYLVKQDSRWLELEKEKDFVELAHESGSVMDRVEYDRVFSGESLARGPGGEVFWTTVPTPGEENEISVENSSQLDSVLSDVSAGDSRQSKDPFKDISLEKVRELPPEKKVRTEGVVAVKPGVLGKQYFYIIGSPGVQIYNFHTDFPDLKPGDKVEVKGEISETRYGEKRINTDDRRDIRLLEDTEPPRPEPVTGEELNNGNQAGRLVKMTGEIVDKKRKKFYIKEDSDRTLVYLQEDLGVSTGDIKEGAEAEVVGLVSKFRDGVRVLPRSAQDINLSENKKKDSEVGTSASGTPATSAEADPAREEWILPSQEKDNNLIKYLLVISGAVIVILTVLLYRKGSNS